MLLRQIQNTRGTYKRFYSGTIQLNSVSYKIEPFSYEQSREIKQQRFGSLLEQHKKSYEEPIVDLFQTISTIRTNLGNRRARRLIPRRIKINIHKQFKREMKKRLAESQEKISEHFKVAMARELHPLNGKNSLNGVDFSKVEDKEDFVRGSYIQHLREGNTNIPLKDQVDWYGESDEYARIHKEEEGDVEKYEWEKDYSDIQLAETIVSEMQELAIPNNYEEYKKKLLAKRPLNSLLRKENYVLGFPKFVKGTKTIDDRPAVAEEPIIKPLEPKKTNFKS